MLISIKFAHSSPLLFTDSSDVNVQTCQLLLDHVQFIFLHGPSIPGSYAVLFYMASNFTFTRHIHNWALFLLLPSQSIFLELLAVALCSSPVAHWTDSDLQGLSSGVIAFCLFHTVHGVFMARILEWIAISSFNGPHFVRILHCYPSILDGLANVVHSFTELCQPPCHNKTVVHKCDLSDWQKSKRIV